MIRALIDVGDNIIGPQCLGSIRSGAGPGAHKVHKVPAYRREVYVEFVYLPIYPYITSEENERGNRDMKEDGKKGGFVTKDSFDWGNVTKIKDAS